MKTTGTLRAIASHPHGSLFGRRIPRESKRELIPSLIGIWSDITIEMMIVGIAKISASINRQPRAGVSRNLLLAELSISA
jgi:hypothetical protein